uniref:Tick transposon n=1 Tax=Rhipicephalus appendiculatus TaxID=34631 RepID=A0A131YHP5_RHIAP
MYIDDMSRLFRRADPNMAEEKKLRHLMRGVKEELFAGLVRNPPRSIAEFRTDATMIEKTLQQRARQYNRDVGVSSVSAVSTTLTSNIDLLQEVLRAVVREELQKMHMAQGTPAIPSLADVVREEVRQAIYQPQPQVLQHAQQEPQPQLSYAQVVRQDLGRTNRTAPTAVMPPTFSPNTPLPMPEARPRKSDVWRTADRRPLCYHCGEAGHLYRACQYRRVGLRGFPVNAPCPRNGERPYEIEEFLSSRHTPQDTQQRESRSAAPMRYRSPSPRTSSNFPRPRSPSPRREN